MFSRVYTCEKSCGANNTIIKGGINLETLRTLPTGIIGDGVKEEDIHMDFLIHMAKLLLAGFVTSIN